jgi:basic membrane protein A
MINIRRIRFSTLLHIALGGLVLSCAKGTSDKTNAGKFRVALLTPGPISDRSWNGGAYTGLIRIRDSLGAEISHVQTKTPAEIEENFRQYGAQGYDLVFGHGFEFQDAAVRVGPAFPRTIFVTTSGTTVGQNVAGMHFAFEDPSYLAGILAAMMSKSGVVGTIGGTELPPVRTSFLAYTKGAKSVNPTIQVITSYIGNWDDVGAGKEQALAQIARKVDVIFQNADAAGLGVFQAAKESRGVFVIGSNSDQNAVAPYVTLGSVVIDLPHAFLSVAREVKEGRFVARVVELGTNAEVVRFVFNPVLRDRIPSSALATMDSVRRQMNDGSFKPLAAMSDPPR